MGRHIWFRTPTKDDRKDIFELYMSKVDHEPGLDTDRRRDELARITSGYSPAMIEQCCSMALTLAHSEGRREFGWGDIVEAMTTVETGTAQNIEYIQEETRAVAIHEAGHAAAGHVYLGDEVLSTRLSIRKRGGSLGHYQSMEKDERFSHFRSYVMGRLITTLGAMAAEHVFYGENSQGVSGDLHSATANAAMMVGVWGMGADPVHIGGSLEVPEAAEHVLQRLERIGATIMNRASGQGMYNENPLGAILADRDKKRAAAQILGQAYVTAYALMAANRPALETDRAHADRAQGASRRRGRRPAQPGRAAAARARHARRLDLAPGMSERRDSVGTAQEQLRAPARSRGHGARRVTPGPAVRLPALAQVPRGDRSPDRVGHRRADHRARARARHDALDIRARVVAVVPVGPRDRRRARNRGHRLAVLPRGSGRAARRGHRPQRHRRVRRAPRARAAPRSP